MLRLSFYLAAVSAVNIWSIGHAERCNDRQVDVNGRCCNLCPPGQYLQVYCSEHQQTVCSPCNEGFYSNEYNIFDRCEKCSSCKQDYVEKCTLTTNAKCSCNSGFLCSNKICSRCEENKCVTGEKVKRTGEGLIEYPYQCEPLCPDSTYFDINEDVCKQRTQCSLLGLKELFPGNKTQNSLCDGGFYVLPEKRGNVGEVVHVILLGVAGFFLLSLIVLLFSYCLKKTTKHKARDNSIDVVAVVTYPSDLHLSKEESGLQLIVHDESKPKFLSFKGFLV